MENNSNQKSIPYGLVIDALLIVGICIFLLGFHIVFYSGGITLIPKEHLTFSETFVDVDKLIKQYNSQNVFERMMGGKVNMYLINKLEEKGIITRTESKRPPIPDFSGIFGDDEEPQQPPTPNFSGIFGNNEEPQQSPTPNFPGTSGNNESPKQSPTPNFPGTSSNNESPQQPISTEFSENSNDEVPINLPENLNDSKKINKSMFDRIQNGMTYSQVVKILGQEGDELSRTNIWGITTVVYMWKNDDDSYINITFEDNKVIQKSQFGL